jgi:hypothetical protein
MHFVHAQYLPIVLPLLAMLASVIAAYPRAVPGAALRSPVRILRSARFAADQSRANAAKLHMPNNGEHGDDR